MTPRSKLQPLKIEAIERRGMDSFAVVSVPFDQMVSRTGWIFSPGSDDLDAYQAAVFRAAGLGSFAVLKYAGQPDGTVSILSSPSLSNASQIGLLNLVLRLIGVRKDAVQWSRLPESPPGARQAARPAAVRRRTSRAATPAKHATG